MAEIYINRNDIKWIVKSYEKENNTFIIRTFIDNDNQKTCEFFLNGKECKVVFYVKKNCVKIMPLGKNIDECNILIKYIENKGLPTTLTTSQFVFACSNAVLDSLIKYINDDCNGIVTCSQNDNIYKFTGYNGDVLTFTFYSQTNKAMIQGKPLHAYSIVTTFLSGLPDFPFDEVISMNNAFAEMNTPSSSIRVDMQNKLGNAYAYLDEALLKSISGSLTLLKQKASSEDYTGCVTGEFKALEGYLKKLLTTEFQYKLPRRDTFSMFHCDNGKNHVNQNAAIPNNCKISLNKLYNMYANKRNVYLHTTNDPSQTKIIETLREAQDLSDEILQTIRDSYIVIFK